MAIEKHDAARLVHFHLDVIRDYSSDSHAQTRLSNYGQSDDSSSVTLSKVMMIGDSKHETPPFFSWCRKVILDCALQNSTTTARRHDVERELSLLPLTFRGELEEEYKKDCYSHYKWLLRVAAVPSLFTFILLWICIEIFMYNSFYALPRRDTVVFRVAAFLTTISYSSFLVLASIPVIKLYLEYVVYTIFLVMACVWMGWDIAMVSDATTSTNKAQMHHSYQIWVDVFTFWLFLTPLTIVTLYLPTRAKLSWVFLTLYLSVSVASDLVTLIMDSDVLEMYHTSCWMQLLTFVFIIISFSCAGYAREVLRRVAYLDKSISEEAIRYLEQKKAERDPALLAGTSTRVEKLRSLLQSILLELKRCDITHEQPSYHAVTEWASSACHIVEEASELFTVSFERVSSMDIGIENAFKEVYSSPSERYSLQSYARKSIDFAGRSDLRRNSWKSHVEPIDEGGKLLSFYEEFSDRVGKDATLSMFDVSKHMLSSSTVLVAVGSALLFYRVPDLGISYFNLMKFLQTVEQLYDQDNPYHNAIHGAHVAHYTVLAIEAMRERPLESAIDHAAVVVAGLCHDIAHPGFTNQFLIVVGDPLAVVYNDRAVLENFHSCLTFKCLGSEKTNVFARLERDEVRHVRQRIIEMILSTDMEAHFTQISLFRVQSTGSEFDFLNDEQNMWDVHKMCLKAADLSHGVLPWRDHYQWSLQIALEFYRQGDIEETMGLSRTALCDRSLHKNFCQSQEGFLKFVVTPLFDCLAAFSPESNFSKTAHINLNENKSEWRRRSDVGEAVVLPSQGDDANDGTAMYLVVPSLASGSTASQTESSPLLGKYSRAELLYHIPDELVNRRKE
eukprot:Lankesteria_metandrocarpae@DN4015_c0_g1_i1.p1